MKRVLLLTALLCAFLSGYSQSSIETALPLEEGDNLTYTDESANGVVVYYTYTAPENQGKLITYTRVDYSVSCEVTTDGSTRINGVYLDNGMAYPVNPGETVYVKISTWSGTSATFGISIDDANVDGGATCADAIVLSEENTFIPTYYDMVTYSYNPTFATYTSEEDGVLELRIVGSLYEVKVMRNCDDNAPAIIQATYKDGLYVAQMSVAAGESYIFSMELSSSPILMSAVVTHPSPGATPQTALELQEGRNKYTFENASSGQNIVYYTYTAPAEQGKMLKFASSNENVRSSMTDANGAYISGIMASDYSSMSYPVKPAQTVILEVGGYNITNISFDITLTDADTNAGATCDDAVEIGEEEAFVPVHSDGYSTAGTYLSYTCVEDGLLQIYFTNSVSSCTAQVGCDATSTTVVSVEYANGSSVGKHEVKAGNTYIFLVQAYGPMFVSAKLTHPVKGLSCDMPFDGADVNMLPKEAGSYWYKYTPSMDGFMIITSESSLAGGSIYVWSSCSSYSANSSIDGYFALRTSVYANQTYLINIEKTEATAQEEQFEIACEPEKAGDTTYDPIVIESDVEVVTPVYNGTYYYKVTVPEGGSRFLIVDAQGANITNYETGVKIYEEYNTYTALASGSNYVKAQVEGGMNYIIQWSCFEGYNSFPFTVSYEEITAGATCDSAIEAVEGENELAEASELYYTYTATQTGWLVIDTDVTIDVTFLRGCEYWSGTYPATKIANINKCELMEGETCIIKFNNIEYETTFFLSEEEYQEGESCENAIEVTAGDTNLPEYAGKYWYMYQVEQDGKVIISSDIAYESIYDESTYSTRYSSVKVLTDCDEYGTEIIQTSSEGSVFKGSFVVNAGDVLYINVLTLSAQAGKKLTIELAELQPGESCSLPIEIVPGELTLPIVESRNNPVWYGIQLEPGEFSIKSVSSSNYFSMTMYDGCDTDSYLAMSSYDYDSNGYSLVYNVLTSGYYYLKLDATYNEFVVVVSGSYTGLDNIKQESQVKVMGNNIVVTANNTRTDVVICDVAGKIVAAQAVYDQVTFALEQGLYIVKVGDNVTKVAIR